MDLQTLHHSHLEQCSFFLFLFLFFFFFFFEKNGTETITIGKIFGGMYAPLPPEDQGSEHTWSSWLWGTGKSGQAEPQPIGAPPP